MISQIGQSEKTTKTKIVHFHCSINRVYITYQSPGEAQTTCTSQISLPQSKTTWFRSTRNHGCKVGTYHPLSLPCHHQL
ncbi:hypothetical protein Hanom_Chr04g00357291 [Helianthus anomalus]